MPWWSVLELEVTSQVRTSDLEVIMTRDGLYAKARQSENEKPILNDDQHELSPLDSRELVVKSDSTSNGTSSMLGNTQERYLEIFPQTDWISMEWVRIMIPILTKTDSNPISTIPSCKKYDPSRSLELSCKNMYIFWASDTPS